MINEIAESLFFWIVPNTIFGQCPFPFEKAERLSEILSLLLSFYLFIPIVSPHPSLPYIVAVERLCIWYLCLASPGTGDPFALSYIQPMISHVMQKSTVNV